MTIRDVRLRGLASVEAEKPGLGLEGGGLGLVGFGLEASWGLQPKRNGMWLEVNQ